MLKATATIKNWHEFQHYKDRSPPWLKLHRTLLDDFDYQSLPLASKALAPMLWLIASESEGGVFRVDVEFLSFRLRWSADDIQSGLKPLISKGFVVCAIGPLATCLQDACLETEGETETEVEKEAKASSLAGANKPVCPQAAIVKLYHDTLPANPGMKVWDGDRAKTLRARWNEDPKRQSLEYWERFFQHVAKSPFLTGKVDGQNGRPFLPGLDWLVKPANFAKVIENRYHDKAAQ